MLEIVPVTTLLMLHIFNSGCLRPEMILIGLKIELIASVTYLHFANMTVQTL